MDSSINEFLDKRVDMSILAKTSAFKVQALARRLAYQYTQTPNARKSGITYYDALKVIETRLPRLHSKARARRS